MAKQSSAAADLVFKGGAVYTMNAARTWADAVAVKDGKILFVGTDDGVELYVGKETKVIQLDGKMLLPGFHDSHAHPVAGAVEQAQCNLADLDTQDAIFDAIKTYARANPDRSWVVGGGWMLPVFPGASPKKEDLDRLVPDRPAYFESADCHSAWVNSRALAAAGITRDTPDPPRGRIERDPATGEPSGTLREAAMQMIDDKVPKPTGEEYADALRRVQAMANRFGITSVQDAWVDEELDVYEAAARRGELTLRVVAALYVDPAKGEEQVDELIKKRDRLAGTHVRANTVKMFADGVIEAHTAALLEPYLDRPTDRGILNFDPDLFARLATLLDKHGFQIHIHAIGDGAVRAALDALEAAQRANGRRDARHHIAHLELIHPDDVPRFQKLNICCNFQCYWAQADSYIREFTQPVLGAKRSHHLYPVATMAKTGAIIVAGSDWPVSSMNPLDAIQVAITRRDVRDTQGQSWLPHECTDLATILAAYTINGAYVNHQEDKTGSIEVGKDADLIVLSKNLFAIPPEEIHTVKVLLTLSRGKEVFKEPVWP